MKKKNLLKSGTAAISVVILSLVFATVFTACITIRTIGGTWFGDLKFDEASGTITWYNGTGRTLTIPQSINGVPVTVIGQEAFAGLMRNYQFPGVGLTSITIPDGVKTIESNAFAGNRLSAVYLPDSVTVIAPDAFDSGVEILNSSTDRSRIAVMAAAGVIPAPAQKVSSSPPAQTNIQSGSAAVSVNTAVSTEADFEITQNAKGTITITGYNGTAPNVVIPATIEGIAVTEIGQRAFDNKGLISVVIPDSVTTIGRRAFINNQLTSLVIPDNVITIENWTFENNQLASVTLGNKLTTIGFRAFTENQLTSLVIPDSVITIEDQAFGDNQLASVTLGNKLTTIGAGAFAHNQLTSLVIPDSVSILRGDTLLNRRSGAFQNNRITSIVIPASVTLVDARTFAGNPLVSVTVKSGNTRFESHQYSSGVFENVNTISSVTLPANYAYVDHFPNNLDAFYQSQNRKAGTYSWSGRLWSVK